jgi:DNA-binding transcriptional LysR family regulator
MKIQRAANIRHRLKLQHFNVLLTVAEMGSMAKAAKHLAVSQPVVPRTIADLENALGVRLFDRSVHGVKPTMYGASLIKCGTAVFDELQQGIRNIEFLADPAVGELTIGCPDVIASGILLPIIEQFNRRYPRVVIHIHNVPGPVIKDPGLRDRKYDLVLARLPARVPDDDVVNDLKLDVLLDDPFVVAAGLHTRWARRRKIDLGELVDEPWILQERNTINYAFLAEAFESRGLVMPKASLVTISEPLRTNLLARGSFLTVLSVSWLRLHAKRHSIKMLPVDLPVRPWPIAIVTLKNRTLSPIVVRFIECAREVVKSFGRPRTERPKRISNQTTVAHVANNLEKGRFPRARKGR